MKKLLSAVLALAMMLTLVACGNTSKNDADNNEPEVVAAPDLNEYYENFMLSLGEDNAPFMMPADPDTLDSFYTGLNAIATKQCIVQIAAMSAVAFEFALIECENAEDVETVKTILEARKTYQVDGGAWYPETCENWEKAEIIVQGNCVVLILAGDQTSDAVSAFNALFN